MLLEGEKTDANSFSFPVTKSLSSIADTIDDVIPHLLKPVVTNKFGVLFEYCPIYGIESKVIQSCVAHLAIMLALG